MTEGISNDAPTPNSERQSWTIRVPPLEPAPVNPTEAVAITSTSSVRSPSTQPSPSAPPTKRQKVSIACQECRTHKTKCDGVRPICGSCSKKKPEETSCSYSPERGKRGIKNQYVQLLEEKVKELEAAMGKPKSITTTEEPNLNSEGAASSSPIAVQRPQQLLNVDHLNIPSSPSDITRELPNNANFQNCRYTDGSIPSIVSENASDSGTAAPLINRASPLSQPKDDTTETNSTTQQQSSSAIDAMGAITSDQDDKASTRGDRSQGYFGLSSAGRFMKQVHDVIDKKSASYNYNNRGSLFRSASSQGSPTNTSAIYRDRPRGDYNRNYSSDLLSNVVLPPRKVADILVSNYWTYVHTLYPFLHKPSFMQTYNQLWGYPDQGTPNSSNSLNYINYEESHLYESEGEPLFQCTLNLVFALGCQLSPDTHESEREASSDVFFRRSKKLLHFDILEAGNIKVVQALLLMGQYLQCTKLPGRCWIVVGLAIRVAQGLGLHLEGKCNNNSKTAVNQLDKELRKRLWGGCIVLDRFLSMAYGRPFMIPVARDLKLPEIIDDEILTTSPYPPAIQPEGKPSQMAFLVHTIKLYEIMGEILLTLYSDNSEGFGAGNHMTGKENPSSHAKSEIDEQNLAKSLNAIIKLEMALSSWKQSLPSFLQENDNRNNEISMDDLEKSKLVRQCNVLKARYFHVCILLYRPLLVFYFTLEESNHPCMSEGITNGLQKALFVQSSKTCVTIAQDLIKTIKNTIKAQLPAWWYSIFYLYTAATVLLMARLFPKIRDVIGEESLLSSWNECLDCLHEYRSYGESANKCYEYLSELDRHVWTATNNETSNTVSQMSSIQILGTLPQHNSLNLPHQGQEYGESNNMKAPAAIDFSQPMAISTVTEWDFDLQDISWLGRLPVYTDLESGYNTSANTWGNFGLL